VRDARGLGGTSPNKTNGRNEFTPWWKLSPVLTRLLDEPMRFYLVIFQGEEYLENKILFGGGGGI